MKLRTKFLLASLVVSTALTAACLFLVRSVIGAQARTRVAADLRNSVRTFENVQQQREAARVRSARLLADLPIVRALMTTEDHRTIQDASEGLARLAEADLFVLTDRGNHLMALQTDGPPFEEKDAHDQLQSSLQNDERTHWWFSSGRLYQVSVQPIFFGSANEGRILGYLALGYEVDDQFVRELSQVADSEVAFFYANTLVRGTLPEAQRGDLVRQVPSVPSRSDISIGGDDFLVQTLVLNGDQAVPVRLAVLKSLDEATSALRNLNRMLMITGIMALTAGAILVFIISHTFTRPLRDLVAGVRALGAGDFNYPLDSRGHDEVAELTAAFDRMRANLQATQHKLLESEKLATIGRMASSVSHDLRHHLVAIMANAEFLADPRQANEREELYEEVKGGVREMNELIESLLEFSRTRASLRPANCRLEDVVEHALQAARMHPAYHEIPVTVDVAPDCVGVLDGKKLERVFHNLFLNAFAAVAPSHGAIRVVARLENGAIQVRVADEGPGVPIEIRDQIFEPFFSYAKENGTGLGLSVAQKIVQDHGGEIRLESTSSKGSVFLLVLPLNASIPVQAQGVTLNSASIIK